MALDGVEEMWEGDCTENTALGVCNLRYRTDCLFNSYLDKVDFQYRNTLPGRTDPRLTSIFHTLCLHLDHPRKSRSSVDFSGGIHAFMSK